MMRNFPSDHTDFVTWGVIFWSLFSGAGILSVGETFKFTSFIIILGNILSGFVTTIIPKGIEGLFE